MKNIRLVLLGELVLFIAIFVFTVLLCNGDASSVVWFIDIPSLLLILFFLIPGLLILGVWGDFLKAFSVGIKKFTLLELKNIIGAVAAAQKLTLFGALFAIISSGMLLLGRLDDLAVIGANLAVCLLAAYYAVILEFFFFPLRLNAERAMNKEMDFGDE